MSVSFKRQPFGPYSLIRLGDEQNFISFVPERNAYVHQICLHGREILWNYGDGDALTVNHGHRNLSLLPFPNRLGTGKYQWQGREYAFPTNDPATDSALHGFTHNVAFSLASVTLDGPEAHALLRYLHTPAVDAEAYPFLVLFEVALSINTATATATWRMSARNLDVAPVPVGFGWHPYFSTPGGIKGWSVVMPPNQRVDLENALPSGRLLPGLSPKPTPVDADWDNCYVLTEPLRRRVELLGPDYGLFLEQAGQTRYTQLFVPPSGDAVAIEPVSCGVDAFRQNLAEVELAPGASRAISMTLGLL